MTRQDSEIMAQAANDVDGVAARLDSMLRTLMNNLEPLMTAWVGQGGTAFQRVRMEYEADVQKLNNALHGLSAALGRANTGYVETDEQSRATVDRSGANVGTITASLQQL
jgi:WXG100 family type VII secretion target